MLLIFREHQEYKGEYRTELEKFGADHPNLCGPPEYMGTPKYLGISNTFIASHYIGADWLIPGEMAAVVLPKMPDINYMEMFLEALTVGSEAEVRYFSQCYGINFTQPAIDVLPELNLLSPLLMVHYFSLLEQLIAHGLKKDYITVEDNLKGKIKGHLVISTHLNKNFIPNREDCVYCRYQIYTEDIPVNRLLKKALIFSRQMLLSMASIEMKYRHNLWLRLNVLLARFDKISDIVSVYEVRSMSVNKLYRHYSNAIQVAKDILRRYDYSMANIIEENRRTPPFWIDMSRLFELYVYSKLDTIYPGQIKFQVPGYFGTQVDYIHQGEKLIIDAKYKPYYDNPKTGVLDDIREVSGYARDTKILSHFGNSLSKNEEVRCLIIYPVMEPDVLHKEAMKEKESEENQEELQQIVTKNVSQLSGSSPLWESATPLCFRNFRKIGVPLPRYRKKE